ncbi:hypothetical protein MKW94_030049 [Papaver nudicaule]|uniref:Uncharacterized protein n=1 Tax=Papaver nudicaule TaxID=74823 RepID=A0AA41VS09_PAPNU|nr:hypothetical protein [Papaver nudicaule]
MTLTIASVYESKPLSYISIVSARILKRLAITFVHVIPLVFLTYTAYLAVLFLFLTVMGTEPKTYVLVLSLIAMILLAIGFGFVFVARAHNIALLNFAGMVSVLEPNTYGSTAIQKSKRLLQVKYLMKVLLVVHYLGTDFFIRISYLVFVYDDMNIIVKVLFISLCAFALAVGYFLGLAAQNLMYHVCTAYDNQVMGKSICDDECVLEREESGKDNRGESDRLEA